MWFIGLILFFIVLFYLVCIVIFLVVGGLGGFLSLFSDNPQKKRELLEKMVEDGEYEEDEKPDLESLYEHHIFSKKTEQKKEMMIKQDRGLTIKELIEKTSKEESDEAIIGCVLIIIGLVVTFGLISTCIGSGGSS